MSDYKMVPKPDITAYELAQFLAACDKLVSERGFRNLPPDVQRHFQPATEGE